MNSVLKYFIILTYFSLINGQYNPMEITSATLDSLLCAGAKFNETSVVVPASCIAGRDVNRLGVRKRIPIPTGYNSSAVKAYGGSWHPNFVTNEPSINNIGIMQYRENDYFIPIFEPRNLSQIPDGPVICLLTGWLRRTHVYEELVTDAVRVLPPSQCESENPHIYCSIFSSKYHETCKFPLGTPLDCDNSTIAGIVLSENGCELRTIDINGIRTEVAMLRYTSMSLFHEWENSKVVNPIEVTESLQPNSRVLCAGVKFNETAAVVPASCIAGRDVNKLGVIRRILTQTGHNASIIQSDDGSWNPKFVANEPSKNNIGIIQYRGDDGFIQFYPLRNLSQIPDGPATCLLTGWLRRTQLYEELLTDVVQVLPPSQCGSDNPHIYCSIFPSNDHQTCKFIRGTPLDCDNSTIAGMVLSENGCESRMIEVNGVNTPVTMLRYTSMSLFHEWQNSGSYLKSSILIIAVGLLTAAVNFYK